MGIKYLQYDIIFIFEVITWCAWRISRTSPLPSCSVWRLNTPSGQFSVIRNKTKCLLDAVETPLSLIHCHTYFMFVWIAMRKLKLPYFLKYKPNCDLQSVILYTVVETLQAKVRLILLWEPYYF